MKLLRLLNVIVVLASSVAFVAAEELPPATGPRIDPNDVFSLLKTHCVRCHGPAVAEGKLNLAIKQGIKRGGENGAAVVPGHLEDSLIWQRVAAKEMPPEEPLSDENIGILKQWILACAPGLPETVSDEPNTEDHWAFQQLQPSSVPEVRDDTAVRNDLDRFVQARLEPMGLKIGSEAPRETLIRRVSFDLTGLPPKLSEIEQFLSDPADDAYEKMVERYLNSERYGERWGKYWLDAAGYADSNGYFGSDTLRPYSYRYRDYVIRSLNADKPWNQFIREQLAGDELAGYVSGQEFDPQMVELLEATHFLRNSPDGTDSSDGNPDEVRADKYAVLEGTLQIVGTSLLGLTVQCARCHDHKFEPFTQKDYYQLQAVIYPALNVDSWITPSQRVIVSATKDEVSKWQEQNQLIDNQIAKVHRDYQQWAREHRERGNIIFHDAFDTESQRVADHWSNVVPGDAQPAGDPPVQLDHTTSPGANLADGTLRILAGAEEGDRVLSTHESFDWTPEATGDWIQATFDLVDAGTPAPYVGFFIALRDFNNQQERTNGNLLIDGAMSGRTTVHTNYPGTVSVNRGQIGKSSYSPGRNYGVRITNIGNGKFELSHVVDGSVEPDSLILDESELPNGGFGFEYCCGRSYVVDNVLVETSLATSPKSDEMQAIEEERQKRRLQLDNEIKLLEEKRPGPLEQLALVTDGGREAPPVHLLERGSYQARGELVAAAAPSMFSRDGSSELLEPSSTENRQTTGRRLAFVNWLMAPDSRPAGLLARVTVNRWWQYHFGTGLVATPDNLGYSGAAPTHPDLLEYLAWQLVDREWSSKAIHRLILHSATYRQVSLPSQQSLESDPQNQFLSRFPLRRLDAEAIRDSLLAVSGSLDLTMYGPPAGTQMSSDGDVIVAEQPQGQRRSVYLRQRRTEVVGVLDAFDAPSIVFNCTVRNRTTVPLQSLKLMNSPFIRQRASELSRQVQSHQLSQDNTIQLLFRTALGRSATEQELSASLEFLKTQPANYPSREDADSITWVDLCQMILASNAFLYIE
ncbi:PSD1 and planctomycete cytochrome C domain-containing protein [Planctomicrobium sp. SH668]|uniref:PSD1 and planctomycete cytochrome C domain-containing protein n=1 Tax=Planctomicrobium sp. SH668 TaxID=3448126 RepID=UPI003F5C4657